MFCLKNYMDPATIYDKQYKASKELRNAGLSQESINAIRSTTVITRNGAQHVVPMSQKHLDEGLPNSDAEKTVVGDNQSDGVLAQQMEDLQRMFSRYKKFSEERITNLERAMSEAVQHINELLTTVSTMKSNAMAEKTREAVYAKQDAHKEPLDKPIDRNKVAPSEVQVEKIFYAGRR